MGGHANPPPTFSFSHSPKCFSPQLSSDTKSEIDLEKDTLEQKLCGIKCRKGLVPLTQAPFFSKVNPTFLFCTWWGKTWICCYRVLLEPHPVAIVCPQLLRKNKLAPLICQVEVLPVPNEWEHIVPWTEEIITAVLSCGVTSCPI